MHLFTVFFTASVLFISTEIGIAQTDFTIWSENGDSLEQFIISKNEKKIVFALQKVIMNPEMVGASNIAEDIYEMYRNHSNDKIRQMALIALFKMKHYNYLRNLNDDYFKEKNPEVRRQIWLILHEMPVLKKLN